MMVLVGDWHQLSCLVLQISIKVCFILDLILMSMFLR